MEYELFRSKLKPFVDGALISNIIRSSSSGLNSHRTAAMELIIEGSIRERHERMSTKAKKNLQSGPTPQAKKTSDALNTSIPEVQLPAPLPAPQLPSQSLPNDATGIVTNLASAPAKYNASPDSSSLSGPKKKKKGVARSERPPADVKTNPSPSEDSVELACQRCGVRQPPGYLSTRLYCRECPLSLGNIKMKCVGCDTIRVNYVGACTGCHRTFTE